MDLRLCTQPQIGASHSTLRSVAHAARDAGLSGFFRADHLMGMGPGPGLPGPSESLVSLAALAAEVPDIRIGTLVASATFRHPSMLAIAAATIDDISGGRLDLGLGSGWYQPENTAYGIDFPPTAGQRFDRLAEQLAIITGLWATPIGSTYTFKGDHYTLMDAPGLPKPVQTSYDGYPKVPLIIGGHGRTRTPNLAARYGDEFNVVNADLPTTLAQIQRVRQACEAIDRNPDTLIVSAANGLCVGENPQDIARRAAKIGRTLDDLPVYGGSVAQVIDTLGTWGEAGVQRMYLQILDLHDLDHIALVGSDVLPALGIKQPSVKQRANDWKPSLGS